MTGDALEVRHVTNVFAFVALLVAFALTDLVFILLNGPILAVLLAGHTFPTLGDAIREGLWPRWHQLFELLQATGAAIVLVFAAVVTGFMIHAVSIPIAFLVGLPCEWIQRQLPPRVSGNRQSSRFGNLPRANGASSPCGFWPTHQKGFTGSGRHSTIFCAGAL